MKRLFSLFTLDKEIKTESHMREKDLLAEKEGREQFKELVERGLNVPVAYL